MAFRALLFSKNPETAASLMNVLEDTGIRPEICADIFGALEKGTKQPYPCILVDWSDQPEARFLLSRSRESQTNRNAIAVAVVDGEPPQEQVRENRLDFLIYRPISEDEARSVLGKARQQMQVQFAALDMAVNTAPEHPHAQNVAEPEDPDLVALAAEPGESAEGDGARDATGEGKMRFSRGEAELGADGTTYEGKRAKGVVRKYLRTAFVALLFLIAVFCFWRERDAFNYFLRTREGRVHILKDSVAALFHLNEHLVVADAQQTAYYSRPSVAPASPKSQEVAVVSGEVALPDTARPDPKGVDLPLPSPEFQKAPAPPRVERPRVPDSIRSSFPISPPLVVNTVNPSQMVPVSAPPSLPPLSQVSEPVPLSEEAARSLLAEGTDPVYPAEALSQKLHGPVVLQAIIGRDGSVQEVKLVHGYILLGRAATAAVKQWRFRPYSLNGHAVAIQTVLTVSFSYPGT